MGRAINKTDKKTTFNQIQFNLRRNYLKSNNKIKKLITREMESIIIIIILNLFMSAIIYFRVLYLNRTAI